MKKAQTTKALIVLSLILLFVSSSVTMVLAESGKSNEDAKLELIMANYEHSLNSDIRGVRMSTVEYVGRYKMSNFETKLIELLKVEQNTTDKKIIALSLFQLGSLNSIAEIRNSTLISDDPEYNNFCYDLLEKYQQYDQLRSDFFEGFVVYTYDIK